MIHAQTIGGDMVIACGAVTLVSSKSVPGAFYAIGQDGVCECKGFRYRQRCRHADAAGRVSGLNSCASCGQIKRQMDESGLCTDCVAAFYGGAA